MGISNSIFKTPLGLPPYQLVFGKVRYFPIELEHRAYWAVMKLNFDMQVARQKQLLQLNELKEFYLNTYNNVKIYKERTKSFIIQFSIKIVF